MRWLICLAGSIASGKSTLADALHAALPNADRLAFGDVVRRRARAMYTGPTREQLQEIGLQLIRDGWPSFVDELLSDLKSDPAVLIVESVRHHEAVDVLRARLPERRLLLVYVEVAEAQLRHRLAERKESDQVLTHDVERDVESLRTIAELVVGTDQPTDHLVSVIKGHIEAWRASDDEP